MATVNQVRDYWLAPWDPLSSFI